MKRIAFLVQLVAAGLMFTLSGCATYKPIPDGYTGPTARISDNTYAETGSKGRLYFVASIDGNNIPNAATETRRASAGRGFNLTVVGTSRDVPIQKMRLRLVGTHVTAAPIHELASRAVGEFFTVEGDVEFLPEAGKVYEVRGELSKAVAAVWISEMSTGNAVTEKITKK